MIYRKDNPFQNVNDCILKDVLDGVVATPDDIDHCAMLTMVHAADHYKGSASDHYDRACKIVDEVMSDKYSQAIKNLKEYWYEYE